MTSRRPGSGRRRTWLRHKKRRGRSGLIGAAGHTHLGRLAGPPRFRLVRTLSAASERRHHDKPAVGQLIIADDGVAIVDRFAGAAEALEESVGRNRTVKRLAGGIELLAFLGKDGHSRIDDLKYMVRPDRQAVIGRIAEGGCALRPFETDPQSVKTFDEHSAWPASLSSLFDRRRSRRARHFRRRCRRRILAPGSGSLFETARAARALTPADAVIRTCL